MKKIILLVFVLLLGGCSTKFAYNNVNWLIYWYIDDFVELDSAQEDKFDTMLNSWLLWHKQTQLPKYQSQLADIAADIKNNNINEASIVIHRERAREHWIRARAHIAPDLVTLAATLSQEQITDLFVNLEKENVEDEEKMQENLALANDKRIKKWVKKNEKGIKKWLGRLSVEQKGFVATFYPRFESTSPFWLEYKRTYQHEMREIFILDQDNEVFTTRMLDLITNPDQFRSQQFQDVMAANTLASSEYMTGLVTRASDKQILRLLSEISDLKQDLQDLQK